MPSATSPGSAARVELELSGLPEFPGVDDPGVLRGRIVCAPGVDAVDAQDTGRLLMCLRRVQDVIQPQQLLAITMRLAPEGHGPRRRDVVALEHALLADVGPDGQWK